MLQFVNIKHKAYIVFSFSSSFFNTFNITKCLKFTIVFTKHDLQSVTKELNFTLCQFEKEIMLFN